MKITIRIKKRHLNYFKENLGAPFIITFMISLLAAAGYLAIGLETVANEIAIYAYYALVIGVMLQIASYLKYRNKENEESSDSS